MKWHQDIQFWPHTNYDLLTIGVFLEDVEPGMGEVGFVPGSHDGPLFDLYDGDAWVGALADADVDPRRGRTGGVPGRPGRHDHGAQLPHRARVRAELLGPRPAVAVQTYAAADALAYTDLVKPSPHGEELIRGKPPRWARHDPRPCLLPPSGPYRPIFVAQQREG